MMDLRLDGDRTKPPGFAYMQAKARAYLREGPERHRARDALGMPDPGWDAAALAGLERGLRQIVAGLGWRREAPLAGLGPADVKRLIRLLHFRRDKAERAGAGGRGPRAVPVRHALSAMRAVLYIARGGPAGVREDGA